MKKIGIIIAVLLTLLVVAGCQNKKDTQNTKKLIVGATPVPHAEILAKAKEILKTKGIDLEVKVFTDYVTPNLSLQDKSLDANYFQHLPYLEDFNKEKGTNLVSIAAVHYEPMGFYSKKIKSLTELKDGDKVGVPNDATNEARSLLLLQDNGIITLKDPKNLKSTAKDILTYKVKINIVEIEAAQLARSLDGIAGAVINGNYAIDAGLNPSKDAIVSEGASSVAATTYANILVVRSGEESNESLKTLAEVLKSDEIKKFIIEKYNGAVLPAE